MAEILKAKPKKKSQQDTKEKLMRAALDVFSKVGYNAATTRAIAKKAGVNESLIQRYFESKLGLFIAIKHQVRENLINQFLTYDASETLEEEFVKFIKTRLQSTPREKKFLKLALSEAILSPKSREDMRSYANKMPPALEERFAQFRKRGQIREDVNLADMLQVLQTFAFTISLLANALECISEEDTDKLIAATATILTHGLGPKN